MKCIILFLLFSNICFAGKTIWKQWYIFTVNDIPQGYYQEEVELDSKLKQLQLNQHWWEKDALGQFTKETFIGATSSSEKNLRPIAFYVEKKDSSKTKNYEGRFKGNKLTVTIKTANTGKENSTKKEFQIKDDTFLSSMFSYYLGQKGKTNQKKPFSYNTTLEDNDEYLFSPQHGKAQLSADSEKIENKTCYKAELTIIDIPSIWWITKEGRLCKALSPTIGTKINMISEEVAKSVIKK